MFHSIFENFSENRDKLALNVLENSDKHCSLELRVTNMV